MSPIERIEELRHSLRRSLHTTATAEITPTQTFEVRTVDVSEGGVAIVASANPKLGTRFTLRWSLPLRPKGQVAVSAVVRVTSSIYSRDSGGFRVGLQFVSTDAATRSAIRDFVI